MGEIVCRGKLLLEDLWVLNKARSGKVIYVASVLWFGFAFYILNFIYTSRGESINPLVSLMLPVAAAGLFIWILKGRVKKKFTSLFEADEAYKSDIVYTLSEDGVKITMSDGEGSYGWNEVLNAFEKNGVIYMGVSKRRMIVIPHRFVEEGRLEELKGVIREKVKGRVAF